MGKKLAIILCLFPIATVFAHDYHEHILEWREFSKLDLKKGALQPRLAAANVPFETDANGMPILNSLPGAAGAIYLDLDGGALYYLNNIHPPYGGDLVFHKEDQMEIYKFWQDVSNHYAMFDINVTTVAPNKSKIPTAHIMISPLIGGATSQTGAYGKTDPVARSRCNSKMATYRSTAITHEIGHNLGLSHQAVFDEDGNRTQKYRGGDEWNRAPYMGFDNWSGVYTHWAIGPVARPDGPIIQDDIAFIAQKIKEKALEFTKNAYTGDGFRPDDFGNDSTGAFTISLEESSVNENQYRLTYRGEGIIERFDDIDLFTFEWFGGMFQVQLEAVKNVSAGPTYASTVGLNLRILDASGIAIVADIGQDPADVDAEVNQQLEAGRYFFEVSGTGEEADLGRYSISVTGETPVPDAYREWIKRFANIVIGENEGYLDDFDGDLKTNIEEFALGLNPTVADNEIRIFHHITQEEGRDFLHLIIPVRRNATFEGLTSKRAVIDGIRYAVQGSKDLMVFEEEIVVGNEIPAALNLPVLPDQWEYRNFKLECQDKGFLQALFEPTSE